MNKKQQYYMYREVHSLAVIELIAINSHTSPFVGCTFTSTCLGGNITDMYMKGFDALGKVAA